MCVGSSICTAPVYKGAEQTKTPKTKSSLHLFTIEKLPGVKSTQLLTGNPFLHTGNLKHKQNHKSTCFRTHKKTIVISP